MRLDNRVADARALSGEPMPPEQGRLTLESERVGDETVVILHGELDISTTRQFTAAIREVPAGETGRVVLDLTDLRFIDSAGLHVLLDAHRRLTRQGRRLQVRCAPGPVLRAIELVRLGDTLGLVTPTA